MPQYDPWTLQNDTLQTRRNFGSPRKQSPAFQREWKSLESSGILLESGLAVNQILINPPSAGVYAPSATRGTVYLWGLCFVVADSAPQGGDIEDDDGNILLTVVATQNGPYFLQLSTPIRLPKNSGLQYAPLVSTENAFCTPLYTVMHEFKDTNYSDANN